MWSRESLELMKMYCLWDYTSIFQTDKRIWQMDNMTKYYVSLKRLINLRYYGLAQIASFKLG